VRIGAVGHRARAVQHRGQGNRAHPIGPPACQIGGEAVGRSGVGGEFVAQGDAFPQVEDVAGFGESVDEGGGEVIVFEEGAPFAEAEVGGEGVDFLR